MTSPPTLTDLKALALHRARIKSDALFLHHAAADEIKDRLELVNKPFTSAAIVTGHADIWAGHIGDADIVDACETLDIEPATYDLVVHAMALHWAQDPIGQLIQCRRALRADGLFLGVSFGGQTLHELRACLGEAEIAVTGGLSPRVAPMGELRDMGGLLQRAGFALPVADALTLNVEYQSAWHLMRELRAMGESNALAARLRKPTRRAVMEQAATLYQDTFATESGRITATFELVFLTGWAPHESQPKPLRPGSAQQRLSDALGTTETKLRN